MQQEYYAHYRKEDEKYQMNAEHQKNVAKLAEAYCGIPLLKKASWISGINHDAGKNTLSWQEYFLKKIHGTYIGEKEDHATLGGLVVDNQIPGIPLSEMLQLAIYMHHGLSDCISLEHGESLMSKRQQKYRKTDVESVLSVLQKEMDMEEIRTTYQQAACDLSNLGKMILALEKRETKERYGTRAFFLGMCERMLFSSLMDADWRDTADFMSNKEFSMTETEEMQQVWDIGIQNLELKLRGFVCRNQLDEYRKRISEQCESAARRNNNLFRLAVPTGSGKTLSSLRFALHCAKSRKKRHIFYVAPFKSILEQNAKEIRDALGMKGAVLEHHSDVIKENEKETEEYTYLIENWDESPVIVTTAVQFFDTLFKEKRSNIRRFHSLCNSVIILDEVQALPIKVVELFNQAINFLTEICDTTVVLCTATQPLFDRISKNRMLPSTEMVTGISVSEEAFRRVEYHDVTGDYPEGMTVEQAVEFVELQAERYDKILVIMNTKSSARAVYKLLKNQKRENFHLSTWMCAQNRADVLDEIRTALGTKGRVICVTTPLIEAGVDVSFQCVIRSMAGLDNLIQAAGRCNRNGDPELGHVYLIKMAPDAEHISGLPDVRKAQEAMQKLLEYYHRNPEVYGNRLDSEKSICDYYQLYFYNRANEMAYDVKIKGIQTNLVDAFSRNKILSGGGEKVHFRQAFKSAGEAFSMIEDTGGLDVVVPYGESMKLFSHLQEEKDFTAKRQWLRQLQRYTVKLSDKQLKQLGNAVYGVEDNTVLVLAEGYYDEKIGIILDEVKMPFLDF